MHDAMARGEVGTFARRFEELKETGSLLLVLGDDARARSAVSEQLLGSPRAERQPIFVLLGRRRSVADDRVGDTDLEPSQVIEYDFSRSVARSDDEPTATPRPRLDSLPSLEHEIGEAIGTVADRVDGPLEPGELRVCIETLAAPVDDFGRAAVESFLEGVRDRVVDQAGMAHAVLPFAAVPDGYEWLEGPFDAVVEARSVDGEPHERWRLPGDDLLTEWFPVNAVEVG